MLIGREKEVEILIGTLSSDASAETAHVSIIH